ncbi:vascular endothelial growth factor A [Austrofundulus limnaeus]|uniref:Vascular endothelial growth factor A n=1 Tax=Austrofundulus limnaeus TaxID=52670 RepID=A0A2I4D5V1_AUSLI|nr:PREDICTED: vascular endothelial growth factor A-like [Austrofundulus limnaeus]
MIWSLHEPPFSHAVVRFMDVLTKSVCQPMEQLVDVVQEFPDHVEYIYIPSSVPLRRCSGCCLDEEQKCHPTSLRNITLQVKRVFMMSQEVELTFTEHQACECRAKRKPKNIKRKKMMKRRQMKKQEQKASCCGKSQLQRKKTNLV